MILRALLGRKSQSSNAALAGDRNCSAPGTTATNSLHPQIIIQQVLEQAPDAILVADRSGTLLYANRHAETLFGYAANELIGQNVGILIPPVLRAAHVEHLARLRVSPNVSIFGLRREVIGVHRDGHELLLELHVNPLLTDDEPKFIATLSDIRERKRAELQREMLAERLLIQNQQLQQLHQAAQAANHAKSEFLSNMSHEIRTPLTAILGYTDLLRDDSKLAENATQRGQILDTIRDAGRHLLALINDILDLCKIEAGKLAVENIETSLVTILAEVDSLVRPRLAGKDITLHTILMTPMPDKIMSDPTRLRQILLNLVGNAVKFTQQGRVTMKLLVRETPEQRRLIILIEDTGPGMTPEQIQRIFNAFSQGDSTVTRQHGGTGLGLAISRRLARLMNGDITLDWTEVGRGACFRLEVPCVRAAGTCDVSSIKEREKTPRANSRTTTADLSGRVLLAEDGPDNQRLISFILRKAGAEVDVADNGRIALEKLCTAAAEGRAFDLLLTDMQMPEMDGYALARSLRSQGASIPIVALTAHAMADDRQKCITAGCNDYITKPVDRQLLVTTCRNWMSTGDSSSLRSAVPNRSRPPQ